MASVQIPAQAADAIQRLQTWMQGEGQLWAAWYIVCFTLLEAGFLTVGAACLKKTNLELAASLTSDGRQIVESVETELNSVLDAVKHWFSAPPNPVVFNPAPVQVPPVTANASSFCFNETSRTFSAPPCRPQ